MNPPKIRLHRRKIGVIGSYRSGKTVFMTSLINHLRNHHPGRFMLGRNARIFFGRELSPETFPAFPYERHRERLVRQGAWPEKTRGMREYRCRYYRSDWRLSRGELSLLDFPGERLSDLIMAGANYDKWSDIILAFLGENAEYRNVAEPFFDTLRSGNPDAEILVGAYRKILLELFLAYRPVISPSSFLLSSGGEWIGDGDPVSGRPPPSCVCGLAADRQFVPLPADIREAFPALRACFTSRYREYRREMVMPLVDWLKGCDSMMVLVDLTALLSGGEGMYQGNRELIRHLIDYLNPGRSYLGLPLEIIRGILCPLGNRPAGIPALIPLKSLSRVAFVATKADKVLDRDRGKLRNLLQEMTEPLIAPSMHNAAFLDVGYFACAAVNSTRSTKDGKLQAHLAGREQTAAFRPSSVPASWPLSWKTGEYSFPNVVPWLPPRRDAAPDHIGLDRVLEFIVK